MKNNRLFVSGRPLRGLPIAEITMREVLANPPPHGVHAWIIKAAWACQKAGRDAQETVDAIWAADCKLRPGRVFEPGEVEAAVAKVFGTPVGKSQRRRDYELPGYTRAEAEAVFRNNPLTCDDLKKMSPDPVADIRTFDLLNIMFPPRCLICMGYSKRDFATRPLESWRDNAHTVPLMVPNTMTALAGLTQEGKISAHALSNTGPRRYLIVEFDDPPLEWQPALTMHLAAYGPLALVVYSGNKSLHLWFNAHAVDERDMIGFFQHACRLGADPTHWRNRSQMTRTPVSVRDNGVPQAVQYFDRRGLP